MLRAGLPDGRAALIDLNTGVRLAQSDDDLVWLVTVAARSGVACQATGMSTESR